MNKFEMAEMMQKVALDPKYLTQTKIENPTFEVTCEKNPEFYTSFDMEKKKFYFENACSTYLTTVELMLDTIFNSNDKAKASQYINDFMQMKNDGSELEEPFVYLKEQQSELNERGAVKMVAAELANYYNK